MNKYLLFAIFAFSSTALGAQNKIPLNQSVYDSWKSINSLKITDNGKYSTFIVKEQEGNDNLVFMDVKTRKQNTIPRGSNVIFTKNEKFAAFTIKPSFEQIRSAKINKKKGEKVPNDTLGLYCIASQKLVKIPDLKKFKIGKNSDRFVAFMTAKKESKGNNKNSGQKVANDTVKNKMESNLYVYDFETWSADTLKGVNDFTFDERNNTIYYIVDKEKENGLFSYDPVVKVISKIFSTDKKQKVFLPYTIEDNDNMTFFAITDTSIAGKDNAQLFLFKKNDPKPILAADSKMKGMPDGYTLSTDAKSVVNKNGDRVFFGIRKIYQPQDTSLVDFETAVLDVWNYNDRFNQPAQLLRAEREKKRSWLCVSTPTSSSDNNPCNLNLVRLATDETPYVVVPDLFNADWGYCDSDYNYQVESQWDANPHTDLYIFDIAGACRNSNATDKGNVKVLLKDVYLRSVTASPKGKYLIWFNAADAQWYSYEASSGNVRNISSATGDDFKEYMQDRPEMPNNNGIAGWGSNDDFVFINAVNDIWKLDPKGEKAPENFTEGLGNKSNTRFRVYRPYVEVAYLPDGRLIEQPFKENEVIYFSAFDRKSKYNGYYSKAGYGKKSGMKCLTMEPFTFVKSVKGNGSDKLNAIVFIKNNFKTSNEVYVTYDNFKTSYKCTDINPQQKNYIWGTSELISWKSDNGFDCDGILYKPENFDPTKKYPMLVYFYETRSETLYSYITPSPSRSTINISYFVSNGYLVFVPDIHYIIGHPGQSALDCIVPGVKKLCENKWVDADNIGIDGQSWGGYQVAYMITRPDVFKWKAAMAGAPVSNMTSAYGGIRWGSGSVRQFQYENTQSRIGKNLWDGFDLYIENSPLFGVPKIETPLLIMHNDKDEAVPWYQGIEYFTAMKRMRKPVWMLQYNGESHNLSERRNQKDLSIRQAEFFNHFLKGEPMPAWMEKGVPAVDKISFK